MNVKHFTEAALENRIPQSTIQNLIEEKYRGEHGRIGRSWGCFALNEDEFLRNAIDKIQDGSLMFAFK